jgi:hypothetical protein
MAEMQIRASEAPVELSNELKELIRKNMELVLRAKSLELLTKSLKGTGTMPMTDEIGKRLWDLKTRVFDGIINNRGFDDGTQQSRMRILDVVSSIDNRMGPYFATCAFAVKDTYMAQARAAMRK